MRSMRRSSVRQSLRLVRLRGKRRTPENLQIKLKARPQALQALEPERDEDQTEDHEPNAPAAHGEMLEQVKHLQTGLNTTYNE